MPRHDVGWGQPLLRGSSHPSDYSDRPGIFWRWGVEAIRPKVGLEGQSIVETGEGCKTSSEGGMNSTTEGKDGHHSLGVSTGSSLELAGLWVYRYHLSDLGTGAIQASQAEASMSIPCPALEA